MSTANKQNPELFNFAFSRYNIHMHSFYELCNLMGGILAVVRLPNIMNPIFLVSTYCNAIYMIPTKLMMAPMGLSSVAYTISSTDNLAAKIFQTRLSRILIVYLKLSNSSVKHIKFTETWTTQ